MTKRGFGSRRIGVVWEDMRLPGIEDPRNWVARWNFSDWASGNEIWERYSVYYYRMIRWDGNEMMSIDSRVGRIYTPCHSAHFQYPCISVHPLSVLKDVLGLGVGTSLEMHLEAVIVRTWRRYSSEFRDTLEGSWRAILQMQLEAVIERVWRCTWRLWLSEFEDALGGSVSNGSRFPGRFRVRFQPGTEPLQRVSTQNPLFKSQHFLLQLSIWVLIVSQHDQYVDCAVLVALSPPTFTFAMRQVFVESRSKTRQFRLNSAINSQPFNEYQSDCKFECRRWNSG